MTHSLEAALQPLRAYLRNIGEPVQRYDAILEVGALIKREELQQLAQDLRGDGKKWKDIGAIMGGVTYQRAFQIGNGI